MGSGADTWTGAAAAAWQGSPPEVEELNASYEPGETSDEDETLEYPVLPEQRTDEKEFSSKVAELFDDMVSGMNDGFANQPDVRIERLGDEDADEHELSQSLEQLTADADESSADAVANQRKRQQGLVMEQKKAKIKCDVPRRVAMRAAGAGTLGDGAAYERAAALYEAQDYAAAEREYARAIETAAAPAAGAVEEVEELEEVATEDYGTVQDDAAPAAAVPERACETLAKAAAAAFDAAGKLTRVDTTGGPPKPGSMPSAPTDAQPSSSAGGAAGVTGGGGGAGYDHKRPAAQAKYRECVRLYTKALQVAEVGDEPKPAERLSYFSSRAEARIRLEEFSAAVVDCDHALGFSSGAAKNTEKRRRRAASMASKLKRRSVRLSRAKTLAFFAIQTLLLNTNCALNERTSKSVTQLTSIA